MPTAFDVLYKCRSDYCFSLLYFYRFNNPNTLNEELLRNVLLLHIILHVLLSIQ